VYDVPLIIIRHGHVGVLNTHECLVTFCLAKINGIYSLILPRKDIGRSIDLQGIACMFKSKVEAICILLQTLNFLSLKSS